MVLEVSVPLIQEKHSGGSGFMSSCHIIQAITNLQGLLAISTAITKPAIIRTMIKPLASSSSHARAMCSIPAGSGLGMIFGVSRVIIGANT